MEKTENLAERASNLRALVAPQQTLLLSTASADGEPDIGYAPFVRDTAGSFYILVTGLAAHTANLQTNPKASVMFIRPESDSRNLFARERAVFNCKAREIGRNGGIYAAQLQAKQGQFGEVVSLLRSLPDFRLFALRPYSGKYVAGFGQAYTVNVEDGSVTPYTKKEA